MPQALSSASMSNGTVNFAAWRAVLKHQTSKLLKQANYLFSDFFLTLSQDSMITAEAIATMQKKKTA